MDPTSDFTTWNPLLEMDPCDFPRGSWNDSLLGDDFFDLISQPLDDFLLDTVLDKNIDLNNPLFNVNGMAFPFPPDVPTWSNTDMPAPVTPVQSFPETAGDEGFLRMSSLSDQKKNISVEQPKQWSFEDCIGNFPLSNKLVKQRKQFSSERRQKVGQVRKAGACIRCRVMKTPVSKCTRDLSIGSIENLISYSASLIRHVLVALRSAIA